MRVIGHLAIAGTVAIAAGAAVVSQAGAQESEGSGVSAGFLERVPAGTLVMGTDPGGTLRVTWYDSEGAPVDVDGSPATVQIDLQKRDKCLVDTEQLATLLTIEGVSDDQGAFDVGLVSNGLGSRESNNCSSSNGRLDDGQSFRLSLGSLFAESGIVIDRALLDIEGKFSSLLSFTATDAAGDEVFSEAAHVLSSDSDNGADAGADDNVDVLVGVAGPADDFDTLTISPTSDDGRGEIALEGGGDYSVPSEHRTTFWLTQENPFEYDLLCGDDESEDFGDVITPEGELADDYPLQATIVRYDDYVPGSGPINGCQPIGADLSDDDLGVLLRKTTASADGTEQNPQVRIELLWIVRADSPTIEADLARDIDLDGDGTAFGFEPATTCISYTPEPAPEPTDPSTFSPLDPDNDGVDGFIDIDHPGTVVHPTDSRFTGGILPWCLVLDERTPTVITVAGEAIPVIIQRQVWDGEGDPRWI